ncbi:hypothetical protein ABG768_019010 [Culter alburnus]|uniref:Integrase core domain-containing protein n=1 Tax=Culter alburnus TaxID=194366 RepID=A0AAW2AWS4_CULAL
MAIYDAVYRPAATHYGMWDKLCVDHGKEFYLSLYMQERLSEYRHNQQRAPYLQTQSTRNHTVERMLPEINNQVNFPLKEALVQLQDQEAIDIEDSLTRFCTSNLTDQIGINRFVHSWNAHRFPGIPNQLAGTDTMVAADMYDRDMGSSLTRISSFGSDLFLSEADKVRVKQHFSQYYPDLAVVFDNVATYNYVPFKQALIYLINVTKRFS